MSIDRQLARILSSMLALSAPLDTQLELTTRCNQSCGHCYNRPWQVQSRLAGRPLDLSLPDCDRILAELRKASIATLTLTGGEPFLVRDVLFHSIEHATEQGFRVSVNTSLDDVDDSDLKELARWRPALLVSLLSSTAEEHERLTGTPAGTHAKLLRTVEAATRLGLSVTVNMVLTRGNLRTLRPTAVLAKQLGAIAFCATKALPNGTDETDCLLTGDELLQSLDDLMAVEQEIALPVDTLGCYPKCLSAGSKTLDRFLHRRCYAGQSTITIGPGGEVRACPHVREVYGNVLDESLSTAWGRMEKWRTQAYVPDACKRCSLLDYCAGGCRANCGGDGLDKMDRYAVPDRVTALTAPLNVAPRRRQASEKAHFVRLHPSVVVRRERFGAVVMRRGSGTVVFVNRSAARYLANLAHREITLRGFEDASGAMEEGELGQVRSLWNRLIDKRILIEGS